MFTGLLPETHGVRGLFSRLPASVRTLPSLLRERDYVSTAVLGNVVPESNNLVKDFDEVLSIRSTDPQAAENGSDMAMAAADEAVDRLTDDKRRFLYIHLLPPHRPYHPPAPFRDLFVRRDSYEQIPYRPDRPPTPSRDVMIRGYGYNDVFLREAAEAMEKYGLEDPATRDFLFGCYLDNMAYADHLLGGILDRLKDRGAYDDALIIVCADHGDAFGEHGAFGHNATVYQEAVHVPLIVKLPGPRKGIEIADPVSLVDLLPTLAALLRLKSDPNWQGVPLPFEAGRGGTRIVTCRAEGERLTAALIEGRYKYAFQLGRDELYDLDADPGETANLAGREPVLTLRLKQELFRRIAANLALREKLGIRTSESRDIPARIERELRTLGYLVRKPGTARPSSGARRRSSGYSSVDRADGDPRLGFRDVDPVEVDDLAGGRESRRADAAAEMVAPAERDVEPQLFVEQDLAARLQPEIAEDAEPELGHVAVGRFALEVRPLSGRRGLLAPGFLGDVPLDAEQDEPAVDLDGQGTRRPARIVPAPLRRGRYRFRRSAGCPRSRVRGTGRSTGGRTSSGGRRTSGTRPGRRRRTRPALPRPGRVSP